MPNPRYSYPLNDNNFLKPYAPSYVDGDHHLGVGYSQRLCSLRLGISFNAIMAHGASGFG